MLKLVSISELKTEKNGESRIDGKVNRKYYTASFYDEKNPFSKLRKRTFWQEYVNFEEGTETHWNGADPEIVKSYVGKSIPGYIKSFDVKPYMIDGNVCNTFTTAILSGESELRILKQNNLELATSNDYFMEDEEEQIELKSNSLN